ncbi:MAG TPA: RDD family protein [Candidatus Saccharimonadales bacterium]
MLKTNTPTDASPLRRVIAFSIDWGLIAAYVLTLFGIATAWSGGVPSPSLPYNALQHELLGFIVLTLPVVTYFAASEYRSGQTLGKYIMRIRVTTQQGKQLSLRQAIGRNVLKFIPWEMAHFCVHHFVAANLENREPGAITIIVLIMTYVLVALYLGTLFWSGNHRPIYDRLVDLKVIRLRN